jgi:hypothetical protein
MCLVLGTHTSDVLEGLGLAVDDMVDVEGIVVVAMMDCGARWATVECSSAEE